MRAGCGARGGGYREREENLLHLVFTVTRFNNEEFAKRARLSPNRKPSYLYPSPKEVKCTIDCVKCRFDRYCAAKLLSIPKVLANEIFNDR